MKYVHVLQNDVLIIKIFEDASPDEFEHYFREMDRVEDENDICPDRVIDLRSLGTFSSDTREYWTTLFKRNDKRLRNSIRCSVLVDTQFQLGIAMIFTGLNNNPKITTKVFEDLKPLSIWLGVDRVWLETVLDQMGAELNSSLKR